jgi:hypothetical protein
VTATWDAPGRPSSKLLVATSGAGLLLVNRADVRQLLPGAFYGIARDRDRWLAFERQRFGGRIIQFRLVDDRVVEAEPLLIGLSPGIHQIDVIGRELWVTDTYNNRILRYAISELQRPASWRRHARMHYPAGPLASGRTSSNYCHFNSVFGDDGEVLVVAHNETSKTGRQSVALVLAHSGEVVEKRPLRSSNAHNLVVLCDRGRRVVLSCASMEGTLRENDRDVYSTGLLTRGLAVSSDLIALGASALGDRQVRSSLDAHVVFLTRDYRPISRLTVPRTQIQELRFVDPPDLGLSQTPRGATHVATSP